jgi:hypothetical protein
MIDLFAGRSAQPNELLANATLHTPDITFEHEAHSTWVVQRRGSSGSAAHIPTAMS